MFRKNITAQEHITKMVQTFGNRLYIYLNTMNVKYSSDAHDYGG